MKSVYNPLPSMPSEPKYSVVIPVYNSEPSLREVTEGIARFFEGGRLDYEIILVNDGSRDASWEVLKTLARSNSRILAVDLLRNYGQHTANLCGFHHATGDYLITMDDDLQNPPGEIAKLIAKVREGYDLVIGRYRVKQHGLIRHLGSGREAYPSYK